MPMFDWESNGKDTISPNFWIYWAVSIPLTLITAGGWRVWWHYQKTHHAVAFQSGHQEASILNESSKTAPQHPIDRGSIT
jgi:hypothetical protein